MLDWGGKWGIEYFSLVKFAYKNRYHTSFEMYLYKVLYGRSCHTTLSWNKKGERRELESGLNKEPVKQV